MKVTRLQLEEKLKQNICDIRFIRRKPTRDGRPITRRMLCTKSFELLNSVNGRVKLNYRPPVHTSTANPVLHNLVIVWDIIMQDYRNVSLEDCHILEEVPVDKFWEYFDKSIYPMTPADKINYMNS